MHDWAALRSWLSVDIGSPRRPPNVRSSSPEVAGQTRHSMNNFLTDGTFYELWRLTCMDLNSLWTLLKNYVLKIDLKNISYSLRKLSSSGYYLKAETHLLDRSSLLVLMSLGPAFFRILEFFWWVTKILLNFLIS